VRLFVDTSVWIRFVDRDDLMSFAVRQRLLAARVSHNDLILSGQVVRELWSVLSRPKVVNGLGLSTELTGEEVRRCIAISEFLPEPACQLPTWLDLVTRYEVSGKQVHDANHVAFMLSNGIRHVLTLDRRDFDRYGSEGIVVLGLEDPI
jgi:predicted nucleic acid-binding protein